jgi:hypothetical protein
MPICNKIIFNGVVMKKMILPIVLCILFISCASDPSSYLNPKIVKYSIDSFSISKIEFDFVQKFTDSYFSMDAFSNPDIKLVLFNSIGEEVLSTSVIQDAAPEMYPLIWRGNDTIFCNSQVYYLRVYDEDLTGSELMGETSPLLIDMNTGDREFTFITHGGNYITLSLIPHFVPVEE